MKNINMFTNDTDKLEIVVDQVFPASNTFYNSTFGFFTNAQNSQYLQFSFLFATEIRYQCT